MSAVAETLIRMPADATPHQAARALAAAGVPVFPVAAETKRPLTDHGFHDATTDGWHVENWWAKFPTANLAIPTGRTSGIAVVDVDVHGTVNGYEALDRAHREGLIDGWELTASSPSGGLHLYFPTDFSDEQRSWQAARAGIDFRGDGGYIIAPPSTRTIDGQPHSYAIEQVNSGQTRLIDAGALRDFLDPRPEQAHRSPATNQPLEVERLAAWVARRQEGERNHGLFWAACKMAEHDVPAASALDALVTAGGEAGLTEREVSVTVRSAYRTVHGAPAAKLPTFASPDRPPPARNQVRVLS